MTCLKMEQQLRHHASSSFSLSQSIQKYPKVSKSAIWDLGYSHFQQAHCGLRADFVYLSGDRAEELGIQYITGAQFKSAVKHMDIMLY